MSILAASVTTQVVLYRQTPGNIITGTDQQTGMEKGKHRLSKSRLEKNSQNKKKRCYELLTKNLDIATEEVTFLSEKR
jgi:hypothetical protein